MHERPSLLALGDDAIIRKVRIGDRRANDDEHIIITCAARRRYSPRKRRGHPPLHVTLCTHARYRHPSCRLQTRRHSIVIIYHYARGKTRSINPRRVQPRYHWFMHCDVGAAVKGDLSRALYRVTTLEINPPASARRGSDGRKKLSTFHFVRDPSGCEVSGAIRSSYTKQRAVTNNPVSV